MIRQILRIPLIIMGYIAVLAVSALLFVWYWVAKGLGAVIRSLKKLFRLTLTLLLSCLLLPSASLSFDGPLWSKSQFPLFIGVSPQSLEKAGIEDSVAVRFSYSNIFLPGQSQSWTVYADMEMSDMTFQFRKKLPYQFEVGIDLPVLAYTSGFLDGFLNSFHDTFGFGDYGRPSVPNNFFRFEVSRNGQPVIKGQNGTVGLGDVRLTVKKTLLTDDPIVSVRGDLEFPTGDAKKGFGNESIDASVALLAEKKIIDNVKVYLNLAAVFPGDYKGLETIDLKNFMFGGLAVEITPWQNWGFVIQVSAQGSPWPTTEISAVDGTSMLLTLGGRYRWDLSSLELAFTEDLNRSGAPDFTMAVSYKRQF